ncbi:AAA family ATPase [Bradyrhizobium sp. CCGUVB1N3]|uniref:ATP-binding protein n=1 Tax=Bradyrhizobium sp. CCGUVB1N3 TaxID=2949629 RepID=UPI0020B2988E|nr:adenylate/guanylate cyclase domain-containing protein [Bradyrhizobium sp. CCGUVB1N3]MCP3471329.1 AAA family ATPase [Bradyrhizobium sp. CCGUVB1N3]
MSVLFADITGSLALISGQDPESAQAILNPVLERMCEAVHRYEGTVNRILSDGIMAIFGAPLAHEDHAVRACYAALMMQDSMAKLADGTDPSDHKPLEIRVGLNSGEVVICAISNELDMEYTVVGEAVHVASRMEQMAQPGSILTTKKTIRLAEGYIMARSLGPLPIKGLAEPEEVYELIGAGPARTRLQAATLRGLTQFIGREAELDELRRAQQQADTGSGQSVAVIGEAGVGKSRLVYEFTHANRLLGLLGWLILDSTSISHGRATSYLPVIALLKSYFGIQDRDELHEMRRKVVEKIFALDERLEPTLPALLALLDIPVEDQSWHALDPIQRRRRNIDAVKSLLLREACKQPVLLIFEDLHWVDNETQELLDALVTVLGSARLMLLVSYRPDYQHNWGSKENYRQIRLSALPTRDTRYLLEALLGEDPELASLKQLLIARGGNPFFIEETVRSLVETQYLAGERGHYRLLRPTGNVQVPPTVQAILAARIDRLLPGDKNLLQIASVAGRETPLAVLRPMADLTEGALDGALDRLLAAGFLYESGLFPDVEYSFVHALTHDVTYDGLLRTRRRALHARLVGTIETLYRDRIGEHIERLAQHAVRGELPDKAVRYLRQAGLKALSRSALENGRVWFEQALAIIEKLPETKDNIELAIDIRFDLRNALHPLGHLEKCLGQLQRVEAQAIQLADKRRLGQASSFICQYYRLLGELGPAIEAGERAMAIAEELDDLSLRTIVSGHLGAALAARGDHRRAVQILSEAVERLRGDLASDTMGTTGVQGVFRRVYLVCSLAELGEFDQALRLAEEAMEIARVANHVYSLGFSLYGAGTVLALRGEAPRGISVLEQGLELCRSWILPLMIPLIGTSLGYAYCLSDRLDEAIVLLEETERESTAMHRMGGLAMTLVRLGEAYLRKLRAVEAERCGQRALMLSRKHGERGNEAYALRLLAELGATDPAHLDECQTNFLEALRRAEELGLRPLAAQCHLGLGKRYRWIGQQTSAEQHLNIAAAMFSELGMQFSQEEHAACGS